MSTTLFGESMSRSAVLDETGAYRYLLERRWAEGPALVIGALNPSTADAYVDDQTIRKEIGFAKLWGFGALRKWNIYALRSTDPDALLTHDAPVGPENDAHIRRACEGQSWVLVAWGSHKAVPKRAPAVVAMLRTMGVEMRCLKLSKDGHPYHPLYVPYETQPFVFASEGSHR